MSDITTPVNPDALPLFDFHGNNVRIIMRDGAPWFVATDICKALDYANSRDAVATHLDDDEKMTVANGDGHSGKRGGARLQTIINESGLYALVLRSRKPEARKFAKWVTNEVLPSIRRDGFYATPYTVNPGDTLTKQEADTLRTLVESAAKSLTQDTKQQGKFILQAWSKLKAHFKVPYRQIPRHELTEAVSIVERHVSEFTPITPIPNREQPSANIDICNREALQAAHSAAEQYFDEFRSAVKEGRSWPMMDIPGQALVGLVANALRGSRFMVTFGHEFGMNIKPIDRKAYVLPLDRFPEAIYDQVMADPVVLAKISKACTDRLQYMAQSFNKKSAIPKPKLEPEILQRRS